MKWSIPEIREMLSGPNPKRCFNTACFAHDQPISIRHVCRMRCTDPRCHARTLKDVDVAALHPIGACEIHVGPLRADGHFWRPSADTYASFHYLNPMIGRFSGQTSWNVSEPVALP